MSTYTDKMPDCCMACIHSIPRANTRPQEFDCNLKKAKITWSEYDTPKECPLIPLPNNAGLRPCLARGKKAFFHKWAEYSDVVAPSPMVGGQPGGVTKAVFAIVEFDDGTVSRCLPEKIRFLDAQNNSHAMNLIESVLDTLVEVGNGTTDEMLHEAAEKMFQVRDMLEGKERKEDEK